VNSAAVYVAENLFFFLQTMMLMLFLANFCVTAEMRSVADFEKN